MAARLRAVDLVIETEDVRIELMIQRPARTGTAGQLGARQAKPISTIASPVRAGDAFAQQEAEAVYKDYSGGGGYGERLAENVYHYDLPGYSRTPYLAMPPGRLQEVSGMPVVTGAIRGHFYSRADLFFVGGGQAIRLALGSGAPAISQNLADSAPNFTAYSAVNFGVNADGYVGGTGGGIWRFNGDTGAWTQHPGVLRQYLKTVYWVRSNVGSQKLVGSSYGGGPVTYTWPDRSILYTDNAVPTSEAVWSEEILVGSPDRSIVGLASSGQHLFPLKSDGLYDLDDRLYSPNLTPSHGIEPGNPKAIEVFNGHVYYGTRRGAGRVSLLDQGVRVDRPQMCGWGYGLPNFSPISGEPTAFCNEAGWLGAAYHNRTTGNSYLCYGVDYRDIGLGQPAIGGPMLWHGAEAVLEGVEVTYLLPWTTQAGIPLLYIGGVRTATGRGTLHTLSLPAAATPIEDLRSGGPMEFAEEWTKFLPRENWGAETGRQDLTMVSLRGEGLGTATLDAYRAVDEGDFETASLGQSTSAYEEFSVDAESESRYQTFKVKGSGTTTTPAILNRLAARAAVSVEASNVTTYQVEWGHGVKRHAGEWRGDPQWTEDALEAIQGKRATLTDNSRDRTATVRVLQNMRIDWEELPSGDRTGRATAVLTVQVLEEIWTLDSGKYLDQPGLRLTG